MLSEKKESRMEPSRVGLEDTYARLAEAQKFLTALESGALHIGLPQEGRTEAKIFDLKRQIAMYGAIIEKRNARRFPEAKRARHI
jgi:hypothetical protein